MSGTANEKPIRIQLKRTKGWRMPPNTVKVDRTTKFGNPYVVRPPGFQTLFYSCLAAEDAVEAYRREIKNILRRKTAWMMTSVKRGYEICGADVRSLRGKNLACWCKIGSLCHADVLLELANA